MAKLHEILILMFYDQSEVQSYTCVIKDSIKSVVRKRNNKRLSGESFFNRHI
jgi:hypothetical protein